MTESKNSLLDLIKAEIPFFHQFILNDGTLTRPLTGNKWDDQYPRNLWNLIRPHIPSGLPLGSKVLDIGCNAGFISLELVRMGLDVLGVDCSQPGNPFFVRTIEKARLMARYYELPAQFREQSFLEMTEHEFFDFVLCLGVYYHLEHHDFCMPKLASLVKPGGIVFLESAFGAQSKHYRDGDIYHDDPTNHFVPSIEYLEQDAKQWGFKILGFFTYNGDRVFFKLKRG